MYQENVLPCFFYRFLPYRFQYIVVASVIPKNIISTLYFKRNLGIFHRNYDLLLDVQLSLVLSM